jgi:hypothetical protein
MTEEAPYSADDPVQVKKRTTKAKEAAERTLEDWRWLLADKRGRRIAWKLLEDAGIFRTSFDRDSNGQTAFNEGQRNIGLRVLAQAMQADPSAYERMTREATEI